MHERNDRPATLDRLLDELHDPRKKRLYPACIDAYKRWLGRKTTTWTGTSTTLWTHEGLTVNVNPELGLKINNDKTRIKLYFKHEQLTKRRVQVMLHLLRTTAPKGATPLTMGILDVPRAKFLPLDNPPPGIDALLRGEARSFTTIWHAL